MQSSSSPPPILLRVSNKTAYVWDVDDIDALRSTLRICGVLTGTLPRLSQQNVFLGVPLVLMPEEAVCLVDAGVAVLVDDPTAHSSPTLVQLKKWKAFQDEAIKAQLVQGETKLIEESSQPRRAMSDEAVRKRQERATRKVKVGPLIEQITSEVDDGDGDSEGVMVSSGSTVTPARAARTRNLSRTAPIQTPLVELSQPNTLTVSTSAITYSIVIPASSSLLEWYSTSPESASSIWYATLSAARQAGIWDYPSTPFEHARCGIFKDLWKQGYFMGGGIKFGGELLVYPGDPLRYHSHFSASVVEDPAAKLTPMEIVAHGRLGTATKKAHLLCGWDDKKQEASYMSIEWAGFG